MKTIKANLILKSRKGLSILNDFKLVRSKNIDLFRPKANNIDTVVQQLISSGFEVEGQSETTIAISGSQQLFEEAFSTKLKEKTLSDKIIGRSVAPNKNFFVAETAIKSNFYSNLLETVELVSPIIYFNRPSATPPVPSPNFYFLNVLNNVPPLLGANVAHTAGITGTGTRVSMLDTGFLIKYTEVVNNATLNSVNATHPLKQVFGVWLASDTNHTGTNFYTGGSFAGNSITLGTSLPGGTTQVEIEISTIHPHYLNQGYTIDDLRANIGQDVFSDNYGHGCAEAANILAVAPGTTLSFVSMGSSIANPVAAFQMANTNQNPDIITCSWGTGSQAALYLEVANTVANGTNVIFACGNGHTEASGVIAHPDIISVGGTYPIQGGGLRASNYASSFESTVFTNPQRHAPDITGLVGELPRASLIMLPTQPENSMDTGGASLPFPNGDNTNNDDGWVVVSGTSAAAPQVAGACALLLEQYPNLKPEAVKNILENTAVDVTTGSSNSSGPDIAAPGWDNATGFGLINAGAAVNFLGNIFNAYIRDSIEDSGTEPTVATRLYTSPDIIVTINPATNPEDIFGITTKHRFDLSEDPELGQDNFVYLRVQNRSTVMDNCTATVYVTNPGMLSTPSSWTTVGSTTINNLEPGEFRVADAITWSAADIPGTGHYCMIAIIDHPNDPAPNLSLITTTSDFVNMVRDKNNVAWKNLNIKNVFSGSLSDHYFYIDGPSGANLKGELQIDLTQFTTDADVYVKIIKRLGDSATLENAEHFEETSRYRYLKLQAGTIAKLKNMSLKSNENTKVTVSYQLNDDVEDGEYTIVSTFFVDGDETGKYTELVRVMDYPFVGNRNSKELHRRGCTWEQKMSSKNRLAFQEIRYAHERGFDNCAYCMGDSKR